MARPERYDPERFGRLTGLLPDDAKGKIAAGSDGLPKELDIKGLPLGEWTARGVYRMERVIPYGRRYGKGTLEDPTPSGEILRHWGAGASPVYLDLETTGLSGGTGTYAFLVGLGICDENNFRVVQLFLAGPGWERNWLAALEAELPEDFGLVTYNGRAFDLPLLRIRYTLARAVPSWSTRPHLDLLLLARHFYRGRLDSCSLSNIEPKVLGVHRDTEDVPGSEIPWMYTQYLRSQDATPLHGIFYHNTLDIVSLAALQNHIAGLACEKGRSGEDMVRCGDLWDMAGDEERAENAWKLALRFKETEHVGNQRFAEKARMRGEFEAAQEYFAKAAAADRIDPYENLIKLAKLEEHKTHMLASALAHARQAHDWLESRRVYRDYKWDLRLVDTQQRITRLEKKIERSEAKKQKPEKH